MKQFILLVVLQNFAAVISLIGALLVIAVVIFLVSSSFRSEDKDTAKHKVYKVRGRFFWGLTIVLIVLLFISLQLLPYPQYQKNADETITVVGIQWAWEMAPGVFNKPLSEFTGGNEITVPVNKTIDFIVTSKDVNHDFAIYNSEGTILTQTQAMPQYRNKLIYEFTKKGDYHIVCLEYCGLAHPFMVGTIHVN